MPAPIPICSYVVRFKIPFGSIATIGDRCILKTNCPPCDINFARHHFFEYAFQTSKHEIGVDFHFDLIINRSGVYDYYVEYDTLGAKSNVRGKLLIDPLLLLQTENHRDFDSSFTYHSNHSANEENPLIVKIDSICLVTVVSKWLGKIEEWKSHIEILSDTGYNMLHFVPLQKRGTSNSPYSIFDQLSFSDDLFDKNYDDETRDIIVRNEIKRIENIHGMFSMTDIVWNHTSSDSEWLALHPESGMFAGSFKWHINNFL